MTGPSTQASAAAGRAVYFQTFGCQMNVADSEEMGRAFRAHGFEAAASLTDADWVVVNTCTVRDHAEHKALSFLGRLRDWKDERGGRRIVLAGCAAERLKNGGLSNFKHVDLVVGAKDIAGFQRRLDEWIGAPDALKDMQGPWDASYDYSTVLSKPGGTTGFVTVMRGCNYSCTYCIVPAVRGREQYRPLESVLAEVRQKVADGYREIMLLGQTVNSYKPADGAASDFADLLRAAGNVPGVDRLRFMSPHPLHLTDRMIAAMAETPPVAPHLHLPLQSGSDAVLARMRRGHTVKRFAERVNALRAAVPGISLTTDLIVGFPGETEADFQETLAALRDIAFDAAYCFKYSPRPGTSAAGLPDDVPDDVKKRRLDEALAATHALSERALEGILGSVQEVLVEGRWAGRAVGQARSFWKIAFSSARAVKPGDVARVLVKERRGRTLFGAALDESAALQAG